MKKTIYFILPTGSPPEIAYGSHGIEGFIIRELEHRAQNELDPEYCVSCISPEDTSAMENVAGIISMEPNPIVFQEASKYRRETNFLLILEPPIIQPQAYIASVKNIFSKIFIPTDDFVDNEHFIKSPFPGWAKPIKKVPDFEEKKFCCLINSNKGSPYTGYELYSERRRIITHFMRYTQDFDLYGNWEGISSWKGWADYPPDVMQHYKFSISYENMTNQRGYITEKIHNSMSAQCVPVYLGATNITEYIPKECFIDRRNFSSDRELYDFLRSIDQSAYKTYLIAQKKYLESPKAQIFKPYHSARIFVDYFMNSLYRS